MLSGLKIGYTKMLLWPGLCVGLSWKSLQRSLRTPNAWLNMATALWPGIETGKESEMAKEEVKESEKQRKHAADPWSHLTVSLCMAC